MEISDRGCEPSSLPAVEFGFAGPLRDRLVRAILDGDKTATTSLAVEYESDGEPLPQVGERGALVDSAQRPVAVLETTEVRRCRLGDVDLAHVVDEGEGHTTLEQWRRDHEAFWCGDEMREALNDPGFSVDDATPLVLERFRVLLRLD